MSTGIRVALRHAAGLLHLLCCYPGSSAFGSRGGAFWARGGWPALAGLVTLLLVAELTIAARLWRRPPPDA